MPEGVLLVYVIVAVALIFDFINGFHDAANSIATVVSTQVLRPQWAVVWAAFFNFIAFLFFGLHVANTIGKGVIDPAIVGPFVILAALAGAIIWDIFTWYVGLPTSSSHALIGGLGGAAVAKAGFGALIAKGFIKIGIFIIVSPVLGLILAYFLMTLVTLLFFKSTPSKVDRWGRKMQLVSAALYSLGHGSNDAQKTMGVIAVLLFSTGRLGPQFHVPFWVVMACYAAMGLGTLFGGWRIVKTLGMRITKLKPVGGFCAETSGAISLFLATALGIPVSTTHTITGSILGVGAMTKFSAVRWGVTRDIIWAWVFTIPGSFVIAFGSYLLLDLVV